MSFSGDLDLAASPPFRNELLGVLARRPRSLVIDLTDATFISSRGLTILLETVTSAHADGIACAIVVSGRAVLRPIRVLQLDRVLPIHTDRATADTALDRGPR